MESLQIILKIIYYMLIKYINGKKMMIIEYDVHIRLFHIQWNGPMLITNGKGINSPFKNRIILK